MKPALRWRHSRDHTGPWWWATVNAAFLMLVPSTSEAGATRYEVWIADLVLGEKSTLAEAKLFAEQALGGYMTRLGTGLALLTGATRKATR